MKRWIALILCLIMATTLFSCAQNEKKDDGSTSSVQQVSSTAGPALATFEDALGNIVAMGQSCVGSGQGSLAEAWLLAGGQIAAQGSKEQVLPTLMATGSSHTFCTGKEGLE